MTRRVATLTTFQAERQMTRTEAPTSREAQALSASGTGVPLLEARALEKSYRIGHETLHVLKGVSLAVGRGTWQCVLGASGSGKSTLLHLLGGLDSPDAGDVRFCGEELFRMPGSQRDQFRNAHVGFVFQFYHLLPELNVLENVMIAAMIGRSVVRGPGTKKRLRDDATAILGRLGLGDRLKHRPDQLSGGERQRVAIGRALINRPAVLLADEPTGNLDQETGHRLLDLFTELHGEGQTILMVSHEDFVAKRAERVLTLEEGKLKE